MAYKRIEDRDAYARNTPVEVKMLSAARYRAKKNGLDFNIELCDIVIPTRCPILDIEIKRNTNGKAHPIASSPVLDRIDNEQGYVKGNVAVISSKANMHKSALTLKQIENLYIYSRSNT